MENDHEAFWRDRSDPRTFRRTGPGPRWRRWWWQRWWRGRRQLRRCDRVERRRRRGTNAASQSAPSGAGSSAAPGTQVNGPNNTGGPAPGLSTTQPSDNLTVGRAPGVNPANPQDASRRANPSDRSLPGARNPQDMKAFDNGTPQIIAPERR
jgi:hypothetical protein